MTEASPTYQPGMVYSTTRALNMARAVAARPDQHTSLDIKAACQVMRFCGDHYDEERADQLEAALRREANGAPLFWDEDDVSDIQRTGAIAAGCVIAAIIIVVVAAFGIV